MSFLKPLEQHVQQQQFVFTEAEHKTLLRASEQLIKQTDPFRAYLASEIAQPFITLIRCVNQVLTTGGATARNVLSLQKAIQQIGRSIRAVSPVIEPSRGELLHNTLSSLTPLNIRIGLFLDNANNIHHQVLESVFVHGSTPRWSIDYVASSEYFTQPLAALNGIATLSCFKDNHQVGKTLPIPANITSLFELLNHLNARLNGVSVRKVYIAEHDPEQLVVVIG